MYNEIISAFAFKTGKEIEKIIQEKIKDVEDKNQIIEAKILQWYNKTKDEEFAKHFNITIAREGKI